MFQPVNIPKELHSAAKIEAAKRGITLYQLVTEAIQACLGLASLPVVKR